MNEAYWAMAWCISITPFAILILVLVYYFCYGFKHEAESWASNLLDGVPAESVANRILSFSAGDPKNKLLLRSSLSIIAGWTAGNIVQDRISGAIVVAFTKPFAKPLLWAAYSTFLFDPVGALARWIIPIAIVNLAFFASMTGVIERLKLKHHSFKLPYR